MKETEELTDWKAKYNAMMSKEAEQKKKRAERQRRYRKTLKGKLAIKKGNEKNKLSPNYVEKTRANAKKTYEKNVEDQIKNGISITRRKCRTEKEMREKVVSWYKEKPTSLKNGIYIAFKKLELQKKTIIFKEMKEYPKIDVGYYPNVGYIEKGDVKWVGLEYLNDNKNLYVSPNNKTTLNTQKPKKKRLVKETKTEFKLNNEGSVVISWD